MQAQQGIWRLLRACWRHDVRLVPNLPVSATSFTKVHGKAVKASRVLHCQDLKHAMSLGRRAFCLNIKGSLLDFSMRM